MNEECEMSKYLDDALREEGFSEEEIREIHILAHSEDLDNPDSSDGRTPGSLLK